MRPAILDRDVAAFDEAGFAETFEKCRNLGRFGIAGIKHADHRRPRRLRAGRKRPSRRRAADQGDEISPPHGLGCPIRSRTTPYHKDHTISYRPLGAVLCVTANAGLPMTALGPTRKSSQ